jgi:hypothetical protein
VRRFFFLLLAIAAAAFAADDPWTNVTKISSGTDVRIIRKGSSQPVLGKFDEANDERVIVVVKNEQIAIPKEQIVRLDARPGGSRVKVEGKTTSDDPQKAKEPPVGMNNQPAATSSTSSSTVSIGQKPDYETVYQQRLGAPKASDTKK